MSQSCCDFPATAPPAALAARHIQAAMEVLHAHCAARPEDVPERATFTAAQACAGTAPKPALDAAIGHADPAFQEPVGPHTPMDIASLTKPLVGATLAMLAVDRGLVHWHTPIRDILPAWNAWTAGRPDGAHDITLLQVLNHSSGLPAWRQFYLEHPLVWPSPGERRAMSAVRLPILEAIGHTPLEAPPGTRHTYSDLGYILLASCLEKLFRCELEALAEHEIFAPLGMVDTRFVSSRRADAPLTRAVVTEVCPIRQVPTRGVVHDENTFILGGVSAHAGVFSTARDLYTFAQHLMAIDRGEPLEFALVSRNTLQFAWSREAASPQGSHVAGWDTPSGARPSAGRGFSPEHTVGHLGFTGTSIWCDRQRGLAAVLLTNRVYPTRQNERIRELRPAFHEALTGELLPPNPKENQDF